MRQTDAFRNPNVETNYSQLLTSNLLARCASNATEVQTIARTSSTFSRGRTTVHSKENRRSRTYKWGQRLRRNQSFRTRNYCQYEPPVIFSRLETPTESQESNKYEVGHCCGVQEAGRYTGRSQGRTKDREGSTISSCGRACAGTNEPGQPATCLKRKERPRGG